MIGPPLNMSYGEQHVDVDPNFVIQSITTGGSPYDMFRGGPIIGKCPLTHDRCVR
jgi:hypothetical protein